MSNVTPLPTPPVPWYSIPWRAFKSTVVFLIVAFHLVVLAVRNPLDLWDKEIRDIMRSSATVGEPAWGSVLHASVDPDLTPTPSEARWGGVLRAAADDDLRPPPSLWDQFADDYKKADRFTYRFTNTVGIEQRWVMFSPPLARKAEFLAVRLEFSDGTSQMMYSENEPVDPTSFFRLGGWQVRKLETYLAWPSEDTFSDSGTEKRLWEAYARHSIRKWKKLRPGDPRTIERVTFVRRRLYFMEPGQKPEDVPAPTERDVATFDAEGRVIR